MTSRNKDSGFTLLEMIVVIAVMGLAMLLIAGYGQPKDHWLQTEAASRQVVAAMRIARGQAIAHDQTVAFVMPKIPEWLPVSMTPKDGIRFKPDGSSSGGAIRLGGSGRAIVVTADWLTGRVQADAR